MTFDVKDFSLTMSNDLLPRPQLDKLGPVEVTGSVECHFVVPTEVWEYLRRSAALDFLRLARPYIGRRKYRRVRARLRDRLKAARP